MNQVQAAPFIHFCREKASQLRDDAGYSGSRSDGGARNLNEMVDCFEAGLAGIIPEPLRKYHAEFQKESDPDWKALHVLAKKFGVKVVE